MEDAIYNQNTQDAVLEMALNFKEILNDMQVELVEATFQEDAKEIEFLVKPIQDPHSAISNLGQWCWSSNVQFSRGGVVE